MSLDRVIGHAYPKSVLRGVLGSPRRAHAYLFDGPRGVGKMTLAREFAKALLCEGAKADLSRRSLGEAKADPSRRNLGEAKADACDACRACGQVDRGTHPYLWCFALPEDKKNISIDALRKEAELDRKIALKPYGSPYKIVCFDDAETLSADAAAWLLKMLEEPPPQTLFLLVTASRSRLPSTIASRCQRVRCGLLTPEEVRSILVERAGVPAAEAGILLPLAHGSPGAALALRDTGALELLGAARELFTDLARGRYGERLDALTKQAGLKGADAAARVRARLLLEALAGDMAAALRGSAPEGSPVQAWIGRAGPGRVLDALERVLDARREIEANANPQIVLEAACGALAGATAPPGA